MRLLFAAVVFRDDGLAAVAGQFEFRELVEKEERTQRQAGAYVFYLSTAVAVAAK